MEEESCFRAGTLYQHLEQAKQRGLQTGALLPLVTTYRIIKDHGIDFVVRVLEQLQQKEAQRAIRIANKEESRPPHNPFLPYDRDLWVADISESHVAVLNKYNVVDHHFLLITREFQSQLDVLTVADMQALLMCLREGRGLIFYNAGEPAGASQPHKHLQWVPLPMVAVDHQQDLPVSGCFQPLPCQVTLNPIGVFPFVHAAVSIEHTWNISLQEQAALWLALYRELLEAVGCWTKGRTLQGLQEAPYNFLVTREWMFLVPRCQEFEGRISVNALGFVGAFMVRDEASFQQLQQIGPCEVLRRVGISRVDVE